MGVNASIVERWTSALLDQGYCIIPDAARPDMIQALEDDLDPVFGSTPFCQGDFYGARTKRFGSVLRRSRHAATLVQNPLLVGMANAVLGDWCDRIQLNLTQAIEIHPGALAQFPHRDQDMWHGVKGQHEYLINVIWPLTPFTTDNGATVVYPHNHGAEGLLLDEPGEAVIAECEPGDALCFLGSTLHGAGENRTSGVRRCLVTGYSLGWLKTYEAQWLSYPPEVAREFSPELAALVGYFQHRPNLGNYEGQCPSVVLREGVDPHLAAIDGLTPYQKVMLSEFVEQQRREMRASPGVG